MDQNSFGGLTPLQIAQKTEKIIGSSTALCCLTASRCCLTLLPEYAAAVPLRPVYWLMLLPLTTCCLSMLLLSHCSLLLAHAAVSCHCLTMLLLSHCTPLLTCYPTALHLLSHKSR